MSKLSRGNWEGVPPPSHRRTSYVDELVRTSVCGPKQTSSIYLRGNHTLATLADESVMNTAI